MLRKRFVKINQRHPSSIGRNPYKKRVHDHCANMCTSFVKIRVKRGHWNVNKVITFQLIFDTYRASFMIIACPSTIMNKNIFFLNIICVFLHELSLNELLLEFRKWFCSVVSAGHRGQKLNFTNFLLQKYTYQSLKTLVCGIGLQYSTKPTSHMTRGPNQITPLTPYGLGLLQMDPLKCIS